MLSPDVLGGEGDGERVLDCVRHLVRIWGELKNVDNNFLHSLKTTASQIVTYGD